jgi:hypothetical protein
MDAMRSGMKTLYPALALSPIPKSTAEIIFLAFNV